MIVCIGQSDQVHITKGIDRIQIEKLRRTVDNEYTEKLTGIRIDNGLRKKDTFILGLKHRMFIQRAVIHFSTRFNGAIIPVIIFGIVGLSNGSVLTCFIGNQISGRRIDIDTVQKIVSIKNILIRIAKLKTGTVDLHIRHMNFRVCVRPQNFDNRRICVTCKGQQHENLTDGSIRSIDSI